MIEDIVFPQNFLWGSGSSSHQVEGNNVNNDWWEFEQNLRGIKNNVKSGLACDQYNRFDSDFELFNKLGQNAHRMSVEWSRIVPSENEINDDAIEHYHKVFESLKKNKLKSFVTVHHFTNPVWFMEKGGFLKTRNLRYFEKYCKILAKNFSEVEVWNTINEPNVYASMAYLSGESPPIKRSLISYLKVTRNILKAHAIAYHTLKEYNPNSSVGIVKNLPYFFQKYNDKLWKKWFASFADYLHTQAAISMLKKGKVPLSLFARRSWLKDTSDFIGVNYYNLTYFVIKFGIPIDMLLHLPGDTKLTQMKWGVYPEGLYHSLMRIHKEFKKPIYITENGIGTTDDNWKQEFILRHLMSVHKAIKKGADIQGYFYWSSTDNFEWTEGFEPRFGLIGIDYETQERIVRDSAKMYGDIAKQNKISSELLGKYNLSKDNK